MKKFARSALQALMFPVSAIGYVAAYVETYLHVGRKHAFAHLSALYYDPEAAEKARKEYMARLQQRFPGAEITDHGDGHFTVEMPDPDEDGPTIKHFVH